MPPRGEWITSRSNPRVQLLRSATSGKERRSGGLVAAEGEHLLEEAVRSGVVLHTVFIAGERDLPPWLPGDVPLVRLPQEIFRVAVETETPQGVAALFHPPSWTLPSLLRPERDVAALLLVLAEVQDPGNVGTLLRSAEAFGATGVILSAGSATVWSGKALRASAGSAFRIPSLRVEGAQAVCEALGRHARLIATVGGPGNERHTLKRNRPQVVPIDQEDLTGPVALLIGNEGAGLGPSWLEIASERITIPCSGPVESLNAAAAGAVMLYEAQRQRSRIPEVGTARETHASAHTSAAGQG